MSRIDPEKARQGSRGTPVLVILVVALVLMALGFVAVGIYGWVMPDDSLPGPGVESDVDTSPSEPAQQQGTVVDPSQSNQQEGAAPETAN